MARARPSCHAARRFRRSIEIAALLPPRGALIGLDLGTKTIGVAASDPDRRLATGVETIARKTFTADAQRLLALAAERKAVGFVLGLPINMDGSEGPRAQSTRAFARNLARLTELPIAFWDERLSTAAVERDLIAADVSRSEARRGDRPARRGLHPAGRARPAGAARPRTVTRDPETTIPCGARPARLLPGLPSAPIRCRFNEHPRDSRIALAAGEPAGGRKRLPAGVLKHQAARADDIQDGLQSAPRHAPRHFDQ